MALEKNVKKTVSFAVTAPSTTAAPSRDFEPQWHVSQPEHKWQLLRHQKRFLLWSLYCSVGALMLGYDILVASTVAAYPEFQEQMGISYPSQPSGYLIPANRLSGFVACSTAGDILGNICSGFVMVRYGRKPVLLGAAVVAAAGVAMQVSTGSWKVFMAGRFVVGIGFGSSYLVAPVWIGENAREELRGFFLCSVNISITFAQFMLGLISRGTSEMSGPWSYKTPLMIQFLFPVILASFWFWFPESPYFLIQKKRPADARRSLARLHGRGDLSLIDAELERLHRTADECERMRRETLVHGPLLRQCFQGTNRKRTIIAMTLAASQPFIGGSFVIGYAVYFFRLLEVDDSFTVSVVLQAVMLASNLVAFVAIETFGRRRLLNWGVRMLTLALLIMGIMGCIDNRTALWTAIVMFYIWAIIYQFTLGPGVYALASEVVSPPLRPVVQSLFSASITLGSWSCQFTIPYMINPDQGNLGLKVGFIWTAFGIAFCIAFFFLVPETKGLSFAEVCHRHHASCARLTFNRLMLSLPHKQAVATSRAPRNDFAMRRAKGRLSCVVVKSSLPKTRHDGEANGEAKLMWTRNAKSRSFRIQSLPMQNHGKLRQRHQPREHQIWRDRDRCRRGRSLWSDMEARLVLYGDLSINQAVPCCYLEYSSTASSP